MVIGKRQEFAGATTVILFDGKFRARIAHKFGKMVRKTSRTAGGIALAIGLAQAAENLITVRRPRRLDCAEMTSRTDCESIYSSQQIRRRKTYGSPYLPAPEQNRLNQSLAAWTTLECLRVIEIRRGIGRPVAPESQRQLLRQRLENVLRPNHLALARMAGIPMQQNEITHHLPDRRNADEAAAIARLAKMLGNPSVASLVYET